MPLRSFMCVYVFTSGDGEYACIITTYFYEGGGQERTQWDSCWRSWQ